MSRIRANNITNGAGTGAPTFPHGAVINGISTITANVSLNASELTVGTGNTINGTTDNTLRILTNGSERVNVSAGGSIGIGTNNPSAKLEVATSVDGEATLATFKNTSGGGINETVDIKLGLENTVASNVILRAGKEANHGSGAAADNFFAIHTTLDNTSSEKLRIASDGQIGLGGTNYGTAGQVIRSNGTSAAPTWTNVYQYYFYGVQDTEHDISTNTDTAILNLGTRALNVGDASIATWDESNGTLTIGADGAGIWWLAMGAGIDDIQSADYVQVVISKNGTANALGTDLSTKQRSWCSQANNITDAYVATICDLSTDDVVRFYVRHQEGSTEPTEPNRCFAMGYKMM